MQINPHFRTIDEVIKPVDATFGWSLPNFTHTDSVYRERAGRDRLISDLPVMTQSVQGEEPLPDILAAWNKYQQYKGRYPGSCDWTLLDEFALGQKLLWLPQIIGSCVCSNTFRGIAVEQTYQIALLGKAEEYFGRNEFGPNNYAFYAPFTYGSARKRGGLRGGDGLFGDVMAESLLKDQLLLCNTPALLTLLKSLGASNDKDFPEPQNPSVYRAFGDWKYLDDLKQYAGFGLETCAPVTTVDHLVESLKMCKPVFCCSMLAIKKIGEHKDGFPIHGRNPQDQWAHNMCFHGFFYASDGELFIVFSNESWGEKHLYFIPHKEAKDWFLNRNLTCYELGRIKSPSSAPLVIA